MKVINKRSDDLILGIIILDSRMNKVKFSDFNKVELRFYTKNSYNSINCTYNYQGGIYYLLREDPNGDCFVILNTSDLIKLDDGQLNYEFHYSCACQDMDDGLYDSSYIQETDFYLENL